MEKIIIATKNIGKAREFRNFFSQLPEKYEIITLNDLTNLPEIFENGHSFTENAAIKAQKIYEATHQTVIADDSGLEVDALGGEPGIYSARYAGDHDDQANNQKLLNNLSKVLPPERTAHFITVLVVMGPHGKIETAGRVDGVILDHLQGNDGFGYDPLFYYPPLQKTFAEMSPAEKNKISHRGLAMNNLIKAWPDYIKGKNDENTNLQ
ncbi:XTP/dITP diphosphatase [Xylocopilactobacillus apis]|uniref:dITP/XTP pyrophosphatase n=1 Tax=Xylocopilactobacillus apis TaxID=2932183 RepID=A0AAU9D300_9LACO|nr:XTP/dITP diphosphatase [Xylocopilactobacillus apis]BDR56675.1 non-canonical purine NTP pyrophosphatase [Xylocopilactobacillus apis]